MGDEFQTFAGGKGANQAVAAQRAGGSVSFLAAIGNDDLGKTSLAMYQSEGIDTSLIQVIEDSPSGVAMICVSEAGENSISVAPGANGKLTSDIIRRNEDAIARAGILLLQLETSAETVTEAIEIAFRHGTRCVLNPAPAQPVPDRILPQLFCVTPNAIETEMLTGIPVRDDLSAAEAAKQLLQRGVENVVITLGASGALLCNSDGVHHQEAPSVTAIDSTGAGDTFNGVLVAMLAEGRSLKEAIRLGVNAATLSVQRLGAIASIPGRSEFLATG
jgi:ribokinase